MNLAIVLSILGVLTFLVHAWLGWVGVGVAAVLLLAVGLYLLSVYGKGMSR